jgi:hypothetical protein
VVDEDNGDGQVADGVYQFTMNNALALVPDASTLKDGFQQDIVHAVIVGSVGKVVTATRPNGTKTTGLQQDNGTPAQQAVEDGLLQALGSQPYPVGGPANSKQFQQQNEVAKSAAKFAALPAATRHAWLAANLAALKAGTVTPGTAAMSESASPMAARVSAETPGWPPAVRLVWLHLRSRRVPAALTALLACGVTLSAGLNFRWFAVGDAAVEVPMLLEAAAAAVIAVTAYSPFGEPERATGRWLPVLRLGLVLALCGAAIGLTAAGAAVGYDAKAGVYLADGILPVARNVLGFTGIGLLFALVAGGLLAWIGPLAYQAVCQFAVIAGYTEPLIWASRPPADRGGWIAAAVVYATGLAAFTIRGPRTRPSGE